MRADEFQLTEKEVRGARIAPQTYERLFHLTDYQGFSYSVSQNSLKAFRQNYISTTWDPTMNSVGGRDHYHFKFILNKRCLEDFPAFHHKSFASYSDGSGDHDWNEREVALETNIITPLSEYVEGLILLVPVYSRSFVQWMFYKIEDTTSWTGAKISSKAPKGIESLKHFYSNWGKPLFVWAGQTYRPLNQKEKLFINEAFKLIANEIKFKDALKHLVNKFPEEIRDHWQGTISPKDLEIEQLLPKIIDQINDHLAEKDIKTIDQNKTRDIIRSAFMRLGFAPHINHIMRACEENNLFHPVMEPVFWTIILKHAKGSMNELIDAIGWVGENKVKQKLEWYDPDMRFGSRIHYRAGGFGR